MPRDAAKPFRASGGPAAITAADKGDDGKPKLRRFSGVAYTGAAMQPAGWYGRIVCALDGFKYPTDRGTPALHQHEPRLVVGHTDGIKVTAAGLEVTGPFSGEDEHTTEVIGPADREFPWQMSIGADPIRTEFLEAGETATVNGREFTGPLTISWETALKEVSFVPVGADGDTSAVVASRGDLTMNDRAMLKAMKAHGHFRAAKYNDDEIDKMDETKAKAALKECMAASDDDGADAKAKAKAADDAKAKAAADDKDEEKKAEAARKQRLEANRKADADEERRKDTVRAAAKKHGVTTIQADGKPVNFVAHAIEAGWGDDKIELEALKAGRPGAGVGNGPTVFSTSTPDVNEAVLECAVFQAMGSRFQLFDEDFYDKGTQERDAVPKQVRAGIKKDLARRYPEAVQESAHKLFKSRIGLGQLLTTIAAANGYRGRESLTDDNLGEVAAYCMRSIQADGGSTIGVGNVTSNVQNKFLLQGYLFTELAWMKVAARRAVKDFKATKSINLFGDIEFKDLSTSGELDNATLQDQAFANQVVTRGRILTIPRSTIINDDLGAFGQVPMIMGRGAGLKLNKVFWMKFMSPGFDDGGSTNFFAATHTLAAGQTGNSNLSSGGGSALSSAGLNAATILFDNQIDPMGFPLGFDASVLLYPPDLDTTARELMNSEYVIQSSGATTKQPSNNVWKGRYDPVKSRYLNKTLTDTIAGVSTTVTGSTANWWLLADPNILPVIEIAFLNGQEMPTVQAAGPDFQFNIMGLTTRAFFDMGVNVQNFRGGVKSVGS